MKTITRILVLSLALLGLFGAISTQANQTNQTGPTSLPLYEAGDVLRVRTIQRPGKVLAFDISGVAQGLLLREIQPGAYEAEFLILPSFQDGRSRISIRDLETGAVLSSNDIRIESSGSKPVQVATSARDTLIVGFDETVASDTIVVTAGEQSFELGDGLVSRSNFFEIKGSDDLGDRRVVVKARTVDGERLQAVLRD